MLNANELQAAAEAVLFSVGEPLELKRIAEVLEIEEECAEQSTRSGYFRKSNCAGKTLVRGYAN